MWAMLLPYQPKNSKLTPEKVLPLEGDKKEVTVNDMLATIAQVEEHKKTFWERVDKQNSKA